MVIRVYNETAVLKYFGEINFEESSDANMFNRSDIAVEAMHSSITTRLRKQKSIWLKR